MTGIVKQPKLLMERIDIIPDLVPNELIFNDFENCLLWIKAHIKNNY
jgi:SulP family sulfate permease